MLDGDAGYGNFSNAQPVHLQQVATNPDHPKISGLWTGLLKVSQQGQELLRNTLDTLLQSEKTRRQARMPELINGLIDHGARVQVLYIRGHWPDIDQIDDVVRAGSF